VSCAFLPSETIALHASEVLSLNIHFLFSYTDLCQLHAVIAMFVADAPKEMLKIFDAAALDVVLGLFPGMMASLCRIMMPSLSHLTCL
jgi:hypothetical protein